MKFGMIAIVLMLAQAAQAAGSETQSLYCRLNHDMKNQDFQMEAPVMEEGTFGAGGSIGMTTKKIAAGAGKAEITVMFIDTEKTNVGLPSSRDGKSVVLGLKIFAEGTMRYNLDVQSISSIASFASKINSVVVVDTTPLSLDGKFLLWCQSTPIE